MQICQPTRSQRNSKFMCNQRTEHPKIARTSDVDHIGTKVPHQARHFPIVSPEHRVVFVRAIEWKGERTAGKLHSGCGTGSHNLLAMTGMDDQKRELALF